MWRLMTVGLVLAACAAEAQTEAQTEAQETVFRCVLENGAEVSVFREGARFRYVYGVAGQAPQLELVRERAAVEVMAENGAGPTRFGEVGFVNEGFRYVVYYSYELADPDESFRQGLMVSRTETPGEVVFDQICGPGEVTDLIFELE